MKYDGNEDSFNDDLKLLGTQNEVCLKKRWQYKRRPKSKIVGFKRDSKNGLKKIYHYP